MFLGTNFMGSGNVSSRIREKKTEEFEDRYPIFSRIFKNQLKQNESRKFQGKLTEINSRDCVFEEEQTTYFSDFEDEPLIIPEIKQNNLYPKPNYYNKAEEIGFSFTQSIPSSSFALILSTTKCGKSQKSLLRNDIYNIIRNQNKGLNVVKIIADEAVD